MKSHLQVVKTAAKKAADAAASTKTTLWGPSKSRASTSVSGASVSVSGAQATGRASNYFAAGAFSSSDNVTRRVGDNVSSRGGKLLRKGSRIRDLKYGPKSVGAAGASRDAEHRSNSAGACRLMRVELEGVDFRRRAARSLEATVEARLGRGRHRPRGEVDQVVKLLEKYLGWYRQRRGGGERGERVVRSVCLSTCRS
jgi:hypothetical protein